MNKVLLAVNAALVLAVGFLFYKTLGTNEAGVANATPEIKKDAKLMPATGKIAFFRADSLNENYLFLKEKSKGLLDEEKRFQGTLEGKMKALQARFGELQQKAPTMTQQEMEAAQLELQQAEQQIEELKYKMAADLDVKRVNLQKEFFAKVNSFLKKYNSTQNFDYILSYADGGQVMLAKDTLDITSDVVNGLNAEYKNTKKAK